MAPSVAYKPLYFRARNKSQNEFLARYPGEKLRRDTAIVLPTGGTAEACMRLIEAAGGTVAGASFLVEISPLDGRKRVAPVRVESEIIHRDSLPRRPRSTGLFLEGLEAVAQAHLSSADVGMIHPEFRPHSG